MKKLLLLIILLFVSTNISHAAQSFNTRTQSLGGTGVAGGSFYDSFMNPALGSIYSETDDFHISIAAGVNILDSEDNLTKTQQFNKAFSEKNINDAYDVLNFFAEAPAPFLLIGGTNITLAFPNKYVSTAVVFTSQLITSTSFNITQNDLNLLKNATESNFPKSSDLTSSGSYFGAVLTEFGVNLSTKFGPFAVGVRPKGQLINGFSETFALNDFSIGDFFDVNILGTSSTKSGTELLNHFNFNVDLGVQVELFKYLQLGLSGTNLVAYNIPIGNSSFFQIKPQVVAGIAYKSENFLTEVNVDLLEGWQIGKDINLGQFLRAGMEFGGNKQMTSFRIGYAYDLSGQTSDIASVGLGLTFFSKFRLDFSFQYALDGGLGGGVNTAFTF